MNPTPEQQAQNSNTINDFLAAQAAKTGKNEFSIEEDPEIMTELYALLDSMK
jgi:hypothetical protein